MFVFTGLNTKRYSHRRDRILEDPRFIQSPTISTHAAPEKQDVVPPDQPDSSNAESEGEIISAEEQDTDVSESLNVLEAQEQKRACYSGVDCIVDEHISGFSAKVGDLLREERVYYIPFSSSQPPRQAPQTPMVPFSEYISHFNTPFPMHSYVRSFRDTVNAVLDSQKNPRDTVLQVSSLTPEVLPISSSPLTDGPAHFPSSGNAGVNSTPPENDHQQHIKKNNGLTQAEQKAGMSERPESHQGRSNSRATNDDTSVEPSQAAFSDLINQLQPEVINNLAKIIRDVQEKTIHFYIHCVDEESDVCWEIKVQHVIL